MKQRTILLATIGVFALMGVWSGQAAAGVGGFTSPLLPPVHSDPLVGYAAQQHAIYPQDVIMKDPFHSRFTGISRTLVGSDEEETFFSSVTALVDLPGMGMYDIPVTLSGPMTVRVHSYASGQTGSFATEMIAMNLSGNIGSFYVEIRESPYLPSLGSTTITDLGAGQWEIDSFFDVFTELSVNGGPFMADTVGPSQMVLVPEPATMSLLALGGLAVLRRRSR